MVFQRCHAFFLWPQGAERELFQRPVVTCHSSQARGRPPSAAGLELEGGGGCVTSAGPERCGRRWWLGGKSNF